MRQTSEKNKENIFGYRKNRVRFQGGNEGDQYIKVEWGSRNKCHKVESFIISPMVEIASQNWPQVDKREYYPGIVEV